MIPKLEVKDLSYSYHTPEGETRALSRISFDVQDGEFLAVVGPSGCGKSTLLSLLAGLLKPEEGEIFIDGVPRRESRAVIGYMLQKDHLFEWRSILDNVSLGPEIRRSLTGPVREELRTMLDTYGLLPFAHARPSQLSGGMRQRAALIRTLALKPDILLLDEPFSALDALTKREIHRWYMTMMAQLQLTTLFITHDIDEAILLSDRIYILSGKPGTISAELTIAPPRPRDLSFGVSPEFLSYKKEILSLLDAS